MRSLITLTIILALALHQLHGQMHFQWGKAGISDGAWVQALTHDNQGNLYGVGCYGDSLYFGNQSLLGGATTGCGFLMKADSNGNAIWLRKFGNSYHSHGWDVAVDDARNIFVAGWHHDNNLVFGQDTLQPHSPNSLYDSFVARMDTSGNPVWMKSVWSDGIAVPTGIKVDKDQNSYVIYKFQGTYLTNGIDSFFNTTSMNYVLMKYDSAGNVVWSRIAGGPHQIAVANDLCFDSQGNICIVGMFEGNYITLENDTLYSNDQFVWQLFIAKYDPDGNMFLARSYWTTGVLAGLSIACNAGDSMFVVGHVSGQSQLNLITLNGPGNAFCAAFRPNGVAYWGTSIGYSIYSYTAHSVVINNNGNISWTIGCSSPQFIPVSIGSNYYDDTTGSDPMWIAEYTTSGAFVCSGRLESGGYNGSYSSFHSLTACQSSRAVYLFGNGDYGIPITAGHDTLNPPTQLWGNFMYLVKFSCDFYMSTHETVGPMELNLFPNPATDVINISNPFQQGAVEVDIYNLSGEHVLTQTFNSAEQNILALNVGDLVPGSYIVHMKQNGVEHVSRFIKI